MHNNLKNVHHIPDLRLNFLAANVLHQEGYQHTFNNGKWKMMKGALLVAHGELCYTLYKTHMKVCGDHLNAVEEVSSPIYGIGDWDT